MSINLSGTPALLFLMALLAVPVFVVSYLVSHTSRKVHRRRQLQQSVVTAHYDPPKGFTPAELGYLIDSRLGKLEMVATLLQLEQQGLVKLSQTSGVLQVSRTSNALPQLAQHETVLLQAMRPGEVMEVQGLLLGSWFKFKTAVKRELAAKNYLHSGQQQVIYLLKRLGITYALVSVGFFALAAIGFSAATWRELGILALVFLIGFAPIFAGLSLMALLIYSQIVGQPGIWTDQLKTIWSEIEGYRDFIEQVELDELQFESETLKTMVRNQAMPYAVALGLESNWQNRFK